MNLTPKQIDVADLICEDLVIKEVANKLKITPHTADRHRQDIYVRTGSHNVAQLFWWMLRSKTGQTWKAASGLLLLCCSVALAQPEITKLRYQICPPNLETPTDAELFRSYETNECNCLSGAIALGIYQITLTFTSEVGKSYVVESTPELGNWRTPWEQVSPPIAGTGSSMSFTNGAVDEQRFYRLREL